MHDLYQLSRQVALGTSVQKCRAWRQLFVDGVFWQCCQNAVRDSQSLDALAASYELLRSGWDRRPIIHSAEIVASEVEACVSAAQQLLAATALATLARSATPNYDYDYDYDALDYWASRTVGRTIATTLKGTFTPSNSSGGEPLVRAWFQHLAGTISDRRAVATAQDAVLSLLGEGRAGLEPQTANRLRLPVLLTRGNEGVVAWLWLERRSGGFGEFFQAAETCFDPLSQDLRAGIEAAFHWVSRTLKPAPDEDIRWWLAGITHQNGGSPLPVIGNSLQAAAAVGLHTLLEGRSYDPSCAVSATLNSDGRLGAVNGFNGVSPKLRAAMGLRADQGHATVVLSPENRPTETVRLEWEARGVRLVVAETVQDALRMVQPATSKATPIAGPDWARPKAAAGHSGRLAILYAHSAPDQERYATRLAAQLQEQGFEVFLDRNPSGSVEWARELDRTIRNADAVIPLVTRSATTSEVFNHELHAASEAAEARHGRPRLVPVLTGDTHTLPESLTRVLAGKQPIRWRPDSSIVSVAADIIRLLDQKGGDPLSETDLITPPSGVLGLDSRFYVLRPTDAQFEAAMVRQDSIIRIKGARQKGKTSLLARGLQQARAQGATVVLTDCQMFNSVHLQSAESFLSTVARWFIRQLKLDLLLEDVWDPLQGPNWNFREFLLYEVLERLDTPLVWALDEVDRLFPCEFAGEVFGLFRSWHNERALAPEAAWSRLSLAMAYATEAHLFISDPNQSPFNVGTRVTLQDFSLPEVADLNARYGCPLRLEVEVERYWQFLGGQPYLTHRGLHEMAARGLNLAQFEQEAVTNHGVFGDHLRRLVLLLGESPELCEVMRGVLGGGPPPSADDFFRLWSAGLLAGDSASTARPRCEVYGTYLGRHLP